MNLFRLVIYYLAGNVFEWLYNNSLEMFWRPVILIKPENIKPTLQLFF